MSIFGNHLKSKVYLRRKSLRLQNYLNACLFLTGVTAIIYFYFMDEEEKNAKGRTVTTDTQEAYIYYTTPNSSNQTSQTKKE